MTHFGHQRPRIRPDGPGKIFAAIGDAFGTYIFSDHEPQYWGFATKEEWDAAKNQANDQARNELYAYVCAYVCGEPTNAKDASTSTKIKAKIAKGLVETQVALLQPENKDELIAGIDAVYNAIYPGHDDVYTGDDDVPF